MKPRKSKIESAPILRCAIYTRKSSEEGLTQEFNSLDAQRQSAEAYIASQKAAGWVCLKERYDDGGFSGGSLERPALRRLLEDVRAGKIDCIVVYKVDRLSRSLLDFAQIIGVFDQHDVSFVSVTQHFNTTHSMGRLTLNILLSFAQFEREIIGERIRDKVAASRQRGRWTGGTPILGYDVDRSGPSPKLVVNPGEAARVVAIFNMYVEREGLVATARELNRLGWKCKSWTTRDGRVRGGEAFDKGRLSILLSNPLYVGKVRHKDKIFDGVHEAIVPIALFDRVQAQLRRNSQPAMKTATGALLNGLLRCKACGRSMSHSFTCHGKVRHRYYRCSTALKRGRDACTTPSLAANEIERAVIDELRVIGRDRQLIRATAYAAKQQVEQAVTRLQKEKQLLARTEAGTGSVNRLSVIDQEIANWRGLEITEKAIAAAFHDFDQLWEVLTPRERHEFVHILIERVEFDAANTAISITFKPTGLQSLASKAINNKESAA